MRILVASIAILPAIFGAYAASADTLEEALVAAHANNPNLEEARLALRSAREDRAQAVAAYLPSLGISGSAGVQTVETDSTSIFGPTTTQSDLEPTTANAQVTQQVFTGFRRSGQSRLARANIDAASEGLRGRAQDVLLATVNVYISVLRDTEIVRLREEHIRDLSTLLAGTRRRLDVGEVSRTDVAQAQTRLAGARAALARSQADLENSQARYMAIVGRAPEGLLPVSASPQTPHTLEEAVRQADDRHPDLGQAESQERAARAQVTIERSALLPQISVVGRADENRDFSTSESRRESSSAVAQFSMPLFEGGYAWSRTRQSRLNVGRAEARTEAQRREVFANVNAAWNNLIAAREILTAANEQVEASAIAVDGAQRERGYGLRSTLDVLDAQEEARNALIGRARANADATIASYSLLAASGALTLDAAIGRAAD
ncbi:TolC family outer membrane protein [Candidatus Viadribacter manganicus]|nr:TolC family outer membrane protein [Candidatus Viadribacter manganicus]